MPDLLTHYLSARILTVKSGTRLISLFFMGTILPDVLSRVPSIVIAILFGTYDCHLGWFWAILHSPIVLILVCFLMTFFFEENLRKSVFRFLIFGVVLHLGLDMLQKTFTSGSGYLWFFPFSFKSFNIPLFWPDQSLYFIPVLLVILIFIWWFKPDEEMIREKWRNKRKS